MTINGIDVAKAHSQPCRAERIYLFDSPRTRSQAFFRLFASHPQITQLLHPLMGCSCYGPENNLRLTSDCEEALRVQNENPAKAMFAGETFEVAIARMEESCAAIRAQGKIPMMKDHTLSAMRSDVLLAFLRDANATTPTNPMQLPDAFAQTLTPVILIRHPALNIPSFYRLQRAVMRYDVRDEGFRLLVSQMWVKLVFDYYRHIQSKADGTAAPVAPIVLDAEELAANPEPLLLELCARLGLDHKGMQWVWEPVPEDQRPPDGLMQAFFQDMWNSTGWQHSKGTAEVIDLDQAQASWAKEWDDETAKVLRQLVDAEMSGYEYLRSHRLTA